MLVKMLGILLAALTMAFSLLKLAAAAWSTLLQSAPLWLLCPCHVSFFL
jgi:hypothetical protein